MTSGSFVLGDNITVGPMADTWWNGADWPRFLPVFNHFRDMPPIQDPWGNVLTPEDGLEYKMALIAAKGRYLRMKRAPPQNERALELHAYTKRNNKGMNSRVTSTDGRSGAFIKYLSAYSATDPWTANDDIKLINKLREKVLGSDFNAATSLVEVDRAMRMCKDDVTNLRWALASLAKKDYKGAVKWLFAGDRARRARESNLGDRLTRNTADKHLWYTYGVKPLVDDVDAALRFTAHYLNTTPATRVVASRSVGFKVSHPRLPTDYGFSYGESSGRITAYLEDVDVPGLLGLYDLPSALYERTLYSFVLDWAIPVGQYLQALSAVRQLKGRYCVTRRVRSQWRTSTPRWTDGSRPAVYWTGVDSAWFSRFFIERKVSTSLDVPFPVLKPARKIISAHHAANAVALLIQHVKFL